MEFGRTMSSAHLKLQQKYDNWNPSLKNVKLVDLCFQLGKNYVEYDYRRKALEVVQKMVDTAKDINFKLSFEQMILHSDLLIKPDDNNAPTLSGSNYGINPRSNLEYIWKNLEDMKARNFRPKQIIAGEAHLAIAYYRYLCSNLVKYVCFISNV